tara:strand:- start:600 stop:872 length:273 start_codon:yes stop_codon:yes gene_type:complete
MKIDLSYFLNKKQITLKYFCKINNITDYGELVDYCSKKRYIPVSKEVYDKECPVEVKEKVGSKKTKNTPRRSSKTSKVSQKRSTRSKNNS